MADNDSDIAKVERLARKIAKLKSQRSPSVSSDTKLSNALKALSAGQELFETLCVWAVQDFLEAKGWDALTAKKARKEGRPLSRELMSRLLPLTSICPDSSRLAVALRALDLGQVEDIVRPAKGAHGRTWDLAVLRLKAVKYIEYHRQLGRTKTSVIAEVARAFGCGEEAVTAWEKSYLPKHIGKPDLKLALDAAKWDAAQMKNRFRAPGDHYLAFLDKEYGPQQLAADAQRHRAALVKEVSDSV